MASLEPDHASLLTTTDHLRLGRFLCGLAALFTLIGGLEAMALRVQLIEPDGDFLAGDTFQRLLTLHGTTMVLLGLLPFWTGLGFALVPLQLGARQLAFPRLAAMSVWLWLGGALLVHAWIPLGGFSAGPGFGWTAGPAPLPGIGPASWVVGVCLVAVALGLAGANLVTTVLRLRAPGMSLLRVPAFAHAIFWSQLLSSFVLSGLAWAAFLLALEMALAPEPSPGFPDWQRLVRLGAHPEVFLLMLPALGVVGEIVATFGARRPLSGPATHLAVAAIGMLGLVSVATGSGSAVVPAAPLWTGALVLFWGLATLLDLVSSGRGLRWRAPVGYALFALLLIGVGGWTGLTQSGAFGGPAHPGSAVTVGHFHLLLSGAALLGAFAAATYWWPKLTGRLLSEPPAWIHAVLTGVSTAITFGILAMSPALPRRAFTIGAEQWSDASTLASLGAFLLAGSTLVFVWNAIVSRGRRAPADPWDAGTLEWATATPVPATRFPRTPRVSDAFPLWQEKHETRPAERWQRHWGPAASAASVPRPAVAPLLAATALTALGLSVMLGAARGAGAAVPGSLAAALLLAGIGLVAWIRAPAAVRVPLPEGPPDGASDAE